MLKVFISQPMDGRSEEDIKRERESLISYTKVIFKEDVEILNSYIDNYDGNACGVLGKSIEILSQADVAVFGQGYERARGCRIEYMCATEYGIQTFTPYSQPLNSMMNFGDAIKAIKDGKKVSRYGWNGKGMYLWLLPEAKIKKEWCRDEKLLECFGAEDELLCLGSIRMYTHNSSGRTAVLTGWIPSQSDMLAEDWYIVD